MAQTWSKVLDHCLIAMGDTAGATWSRTLTIWPWVQEAVLNFPILRPMLDDHTNGASIVYSYAANTDFREVISVEYPISQQPPTLLVRKNRLDPDFWDAAGYYDIDHDYSTGSGWTVYVSGGVAALAHIKMQYLANHDTTITDDSVDVWSIPDQYEGIIIAYVLAKGYRERLSKYMQDPTAHTSLIMQMTTMVDKAEENYRELAQAAHARLADSKITPNVAVDKFDRVY
jgi:hypothetical protein